VVCRVARRRLLADAEHRDLQAMRRDTKVADMTPEPQYDPAIAASLIDSALPDWECVLRCQRDQALARAANAEIALDDCTVITGVACGVALLVGFVAGWAYWGLAR
jgi:hypothetical protein